MVRAHVCTASGYAHFMSTQPHEAQIIERLLAGDESAFASLVDEHHCALCKVASFFVVNASVAEEVVQETWLAVIHGLAKFEHRSSLKTWIFGILINMAKKRAKRDARSIAWSSFSAQHIEDMPDPDQHRFKSNGRWSVPPGVWTETPEDDFLHSRLLEVVHETIETLPIPQRIVVTMCDLEGMCTADVCAVLHVSHNHQRVLLHRARATIREAVEVYLDKQ